MTNKFLHKLDKGAKTHCNSMVIPVLHFHKCFYRMHSKSFRVIQCNLLRVPSFIYTILNITEPLIHVHLCIRLLYTSYAVEIETLTIYSWQHYCNIYFLIKDCRITGMQIDRTFFAAFAMQEACWSNPCVCFDSIK